MNVSPCCAAKRSRSARRAIEPSGFKISQITPAGYSPASRARSTLDSVCPTRCSTPRRRVDADRERGLVRLGIMLGHLRQAERLAALRHQGQADEPAPVRRHEIDHVGGDPLGGADQVSLVLAPLVIGHNDELPGTDVRDCLLYVSERHSCLTYLPRTSA